MAQTAIKLLIPSFPREAQRGFFMRQHPVLNGIFAIACGVLTNAGTAQAGNESWVSATGNDTGTCPITAPCRTFAYAHDQTVANGTINVLSSGSFVL